MSIHPRSYCAATLCLSTLLLGCSHDTSITAVDGRQAEPHARAVA